MDLQATGSEEVVFHGEERQCRPTGYAELPVDVLNIVLRGAARDHELLRDLRIREAGSDETQDLDFAVAQTCGSEVMLPRARLARGFENGGCAVTVEEACACLGGEGFGGLLRGQTRAVWPILRHRLKRISRGEYSYAHGLIPGSCAPVIAGAVDPLMVHARDRR